MSPFCNTPNISTLHSCYSNNACHQPRDFTGFLGFCEATCGRTLFLNAAAVTSKTTSERGKSFMLHISASLLSEISRILISRPHPPPKNKSQITNHLNEYESKRHSPRDMSSIHWCKRSLSFSWTSNDLASGHVGHGALYSKPGSLLTGLLVRLVVSIPSKQCGSSSQLLAHHLKNIGRHSCCM